MRLQFQSVRDTVRDSPCFAKNFLGVSNLYCEAKPESSPLLSLRQRIVAFALAFFIAQFVGLFGSPDLGFAPREAHAAPWTGNIANGFAGGSGIESDPFQINTPEQLAYLAQEVKANNTAFNAAYYKLTADIDLGGTHNWTPIGVTYTFKGSFDGNNHVVDRMKITADATYISNNGIEIGLFGSVNGNIASLGIIKNLGVTNCSIEVTHSASNKNLWLGPLVGSLSTGTVTNSYATGSMTIYQTATGNSNNYQIGGLVGHTEGNVSISGSYANVPFSLTSASGRPIGDGLVGYMSSASARITDSYSTGSVFVSSSGTTIAGGLVGYCGGSVTRSYSTSSVSTENTSTSISYAGGLVGENQGTINDSFSEGLVKAGNTYATNYYAGGLVGHNNANASIITSYAWGGIDPSVQMAKRGGLVGYLALGSITSCDWRGDDAAGINAGLTAAIAQDDVTVDAAHLKRLDTAQFKRPANFLLQGWDFDTVWCYTNSDNGARPRLRAFTSASDIMEISDNKDILDVSLTLDGVAYKAVLQEDGRTWLMNLPAGTNLSALNPSISISDKATLSPQGPYDFSQNTVSVTVTAFDGTEKKYALMITAKGSDPTEDLKGRISSFAVRNIPVAPVDGDASFDLHIEWKARTDTETDDMRPPDEWPLPKPTVTWSITTPSGGGAWDVSIDVDPDNFFRARLIVDTKGNPPPANRERYYVSVHLQQVVEGQTVFDETYQRGFYTGEKFLTTVTLSPEAQGEIDRANAVLAQTDVEIVPGNHQTRIPQHLIDAIVDHLENNLVTYEDASARAAAIAAGTDTGLSTARPEVVSAFFARQAERRASGEEARAASGDIEIYILDDIEAIRMATRSPEPEKVPDCFDCVDKMSANIVLDLTLLSDDVQSKVIMLPMSYTVTIRSNDMAELYAGYPIDAMVANPENYLDEIFEILVLHKRIHEGDMLDWYTRLIRGVAQPYEAYDTGMLLVWSDVDEGSITLSLGYYVINYHGESFTVSDDSVGYIILPDGDRNDTLIDPLWLNKWSTDTGGGGGGGGGCTTGTAVLATITAFCAISLGRRSRRRNRRD